MKVQLNKNALRAWLANTGHSRTVTYTTEALSPNSTEKRFIETEYDYVPLAQEAITATNCQFASCCDDQKAHGILRNRDSERLWSDY